MFAGFNLKLSDKFFGNKYQSYIDIAKREQKSYQKRLDSEIPEKIIKKFKDGEALNGDLILKTWFPKFNVDVFISHSHDDTNLANAFAGWLFEKFEIKSFIDSNVWGYIDSLLDILNDNYSHKRSNGTYGYIYDHNCCSKASQHANIMLLMSLQTMIDNTEAVFFLNTDKSVNVIDETGLCSTYSPWIYAELLCADLIRKTPLEEYRKRYFTESFELNSVYENRSELKIKYGISTEHLYKLNESSMHEWVRRFQNEKKVIPLDLLYKLFVKEVLNDNDTK